jgi:hypothetical protein
MASAHTSSRDARRVTKKIAGFQKFPQPIESGIGSNEDLIRQQTGHRIVHFGNYSNDEGRKMT